MGCTVDVIATLGACGVFLETRMGVLLHPLNGIAARFGVVPRLLASVRFWFQRVLWDAMHVLCVCTYGVNTCQPDWDCRAADQPP